jgi:hypothetical protein
VRVAQEMPGFEDVIHPLGGDRAGFPWLVILRPDRSIVIDSTEPERGRNIGFPVADWEIEYLGVMMRTAATQITEAEVDAMIKTLGEGGGP